MGIDWTSLMKKYKSQWITLKDDEKTVITSGETAQNALASARVKGYENPILTRVPDKVVSYVG